MRNVPISIADGAVCAVIDAFAQVLAGLEVRNVLAGERHCLSGLGIAALTWRPEVQRERAEAAYLDAISRRQRIAHDLQDLLERELHILGWQVFLFCRDDLDELGLGHGPLPSSCCFSRGLTVQRSPPICSLSRSPRLVPDEG